MIAQVREALRRKPLIGVVASLAIHAALVLALFWVHPMATSGQKRGDALIVELPSPESGRGTPGPQADAPATPDPPAPAPAPQAPPAPRTAPPRPQPPAPVRPPAAARPTPAPKGEPRETPRAIASAPQPPPATDSGDVPAAKSAPQAPSEAATPEPATPEPPAPPAVASAPPSAPASPPGPVASIPPPIDSRSVLRRGSGGGGIGAGGAGGTGAGRGGIVGEAIPLDSKEDDVQDYFERIRRLIKQNWVYPCVKNRETSVCEYKSAVLTVEFGILKPGPLQYVEVRSASQYGIYDEFAVNAIKLASPFPPVPPAVMARMGRGSAGASILVRFVYVYETGITNILR